MNVLFALAALVAMPDYLTEVVSPVYEKPGAPADLARRAEACLSQQLGQVEGGPLILSSDPATGVVVANNTLEYRDGLVSWRLRSRLTFEGREGRFRLRHTSIERHNDQSFAASSLGASPWAPVGKWWGSGWQRAQEALEGVSGRVSECVLAETSNDDW